MGMSTMRHHLVVLRENYLRLFMSGRKQIECRLSAVRRAPFEAVSPGDLIWFKLPSRPVCATAIVSRCLFKNLDHPGRLETLVSDYGDGICAAAGFFDDAAEWAKYMSLVWVDTVMRFSPMRVSKSDQRAWVVLDGAPRPGMRIGSCRTRRGPVSSGVDAVSNSQRRSPRSC